MIIFALKECWRHRPHSGPVQCITGFLQDHSHFFIHSAGMIELANMVCCCICFLLPLPVKPATCPGINSLTYCSRSVFSVSHGCQPGIFSAQRASNMERILMVFSPHVNSSLHAMLAPQLLCYMLCWVLSSLSHVVVGLGHLYYWACPGCH